MKDCCDYEIELSALFDGESNQAVALKLVEHVAACSSCSSFVRDLRGTQAIIDSLPVDKQTEAVAGTTQSLEKRRLKVLGLRPQWAIGIAAALILTVSIWFGTGVGKPFGLTNDIRDGELVIRLEEDKGRMSDERFVALVSELLRADRRYQDEMYVVLDEITQTRSSGESRSVRRSDRTGENHNSEHTEPSLPPTAAME